MRLLCEPFWTVYRLCKVGRRLFLLLQVGRSSNDGRYSCEFIDEQFLYIQLHLLRIRTVHESSAEKFD